MRTTYRVAGWGTLGFAIGFFVTFVVNSVINTVVEFPRYPLPEEMAQAMWYGAVFALLWGTAGAALVVAAIGLPALVFAAGGLGRQIASAFGIIAAAGWIFSAAAAFAQRTPLLNGNITATGADPDAQRAVVGGLVVLVHLGGHVFALTAVPWLAMVAVRSAGILPKTVTVLLWLAALGPLAGFLITGYQFGLMLVLVSFAVIGPILLVRARRAGSAVPALTTATVSTA